MISLPWKVLYRTDLPPVGRRKSATGRRSRESGRCRHCPLVDFGLEGEGKAESTEDFGLVFVRTWQVGLPLDVAVCGVEIGQSSNATRASSGLLLVVLLHALMLLTGFLVSNYLNEITYSSQRAMVLSFKGLAFNLGDGALGLRYAGLLVLLHRRVRPSTRLRSSGIRCLACWGMGSSPVCCSSRSCRRGCPPGAEESGW
jgi:hypothetical protein